MIGVVKGGRSGNLTDPSHLGHTGWGPAATLARAAAPNKARAMAAWVVHRVTSLTPERYAAAVAAFHLIVLALSWRMLGKCADVSRCRASSLPWLRSLSWEVGSVAVLAYVVSLAAPFVANLDDPRRRHVGEISGRLMGQALFGEAILVGFVLAYRHRRAGRPGRAAALGSVALGLCALYVEAYRLEPRQLFVRRHVVGPPGPRQAVVRILHITDIQAPVIGAHEERALRTGLSYRPDLIVLTGDYVQDALGRRTEERAAFDLQALINRIGFRAPLGVFATEGDVGPPCRAVFAHTEVTCLTDESALVRLPDGGSLRITGLSRNRGRERNPAWLRGLFAAGAPGDHHVVISHSPDFVAALPERVDLALAGHTHGGQFVLPFIGPLVTASRLPRRYAADLNDYAGIPLHVSRGVGMERGFAPPVRFLCPPEICLVDLGL
jgi:predicted MPP superfamily phosphohydrolase